VGVEATMAAPVHDGAEVIGCLVVGSTTPRRTYSQAEQDLLLAFAEHASLAVTDARTVEALHQAVGDATHRSLHDPLTGAANRTRFLDRLGHALSQRRAPGTTVAVLYVDVDDFKAVNDRFGHVVGDQLLIETARRLQTAVRMGDTVARLGGDEFAVLIEHAAGAPEASAAAGRVLELLRHPFRFGATSVATSASVGVAMLETESCSAEDLLRNADVAMYRAKNSGKDRAVVFESAMYEAILERLGLETELRRAVRNNGIEVFFQPIVRLRDQRVLGVEALARWAHPERGYVAPDTFIPLAEDTGLITELGEQVLVRACSWAGRWHREHPGSALFVSVNLSARQLQDPSLPAVVDRALVDSGLDPEALVLEVTERALMDDEDLSATRVRQIRALGVALALDDFGTGYSSLSSLQRFPVDVLKIDRPFVQALGAGEDPQRLVEAVVALSDAMGLQCLAEGIELEEELAALRQLGCDLAQGRYFAGAMPAPALARYLDSRLPDSAAGLTA
ncbi:MAG TPA: EAL domain-containing protein, partial [Acidimicrobiales bacterium]|nr:EAL domain-containing protein [Acidimicrobiales bacterium]